MKDMVKEIVDMDRKAREIMDEAQQEKLDSEKEISQMREENPGRLSGKGARTDQTQ